MRDTDINEKRPVIISPKSFTDVNISNPFVIVTRGYNNTDNHIGTNYSICSDIYGHNVLLKLEAEDNSTYFSVPSDQLEFLSHNKLYYLFAQYIGDETGLSPWSDPVCFRVNIPSQTSSMNFEPVFTNSMMTKRSIELIPYELRSSPLYQLVCELIDRTLDVCKAPYDTREQIVSPLIDQLLNKKNDFGNVVAGYNSVESINIYYNTMIKPVIGTKSVIDSILRLLNNDATIVEWWERRLASFKFALEYEDNATPTINIPELISLINSFKNERSHLISIRNKSCESTMVFDYSKWDYDWYDNLPGTEIDGVFVCLRKYIREVIINSFLEQTYQVITWDNNQLVSALLGGRRWDRLFWDDSIYANYQNINQGYTSLFVLNFDEVFKDLESKLSAALTDLFHFDFSSVQLEGFGLVHNICEFEDDRYWYGTWEKPEKIGTYPKYTLALSGLDEFDTNDWEFFENDLEWNIRVGDYDFIDDEIGITNLIRGIVTGFDSAFAYESFDYYYSQLYNSRDRKKRWDYWKWGDSYEIDIAQKYFLILKTEDTEVEGLDYFKRDEDWIVQYEDPERAFNTFFTGYYEFSYLPTGVELFELRYTDHVGEFALRRWDTFTWDKFASKKTEFHYTIEVLPEDFVAWRRATVQDFTYLQNDTNWTIKFDDEIDHQVGPNEIRSFSSDSLPDIIGLGVQVENLFDLYDYRFGGVSKWDDFDWDITTEGISQRYVLEVLIQSENDNLHYYKDDPNWFISFGEFNDDIAVAVDWYKYFIKTDYTKVKTILCLTTNLNSFIDVSYHGALWDWDDWDEEVENKQISQKLTIELTRNPYSTEYNDLKDNPDWRIESGLFNEEVWSTTDVHSFTGAYTYPVSSEELLIGLCYVDIVEEWNSDWDKFDWDIDKEATKREYNRLTLELIKEDSSFNVSAYKEDTEWQVIYGKQDIEIGVFNFQTIFANVYEATEIDCLFTVHSFNFAEARLNSHRWDEFVVDSESNFELKQDNYKQYSIAVIDRELADNKILNEFSKDCDWAVLFIDKDDMPGTRNKKIFALLEQEVPVQQSLEFFINELTQTKQTDYCFDETDWDSPEPFVDTTVLSFIVLKDKHVDQDILQWYQNDNNWNVLFEGIDDTPVSTTTKYLEWIQEYSNIPDYLSYTYNFTSYNEVLNFNQRWDYVKHDSIPKNFITQLYTLAILDKEKEYPVNELYYYKEHFWNIKFAQTDDMPGIDSSGIEELIENVFPDYNTEAFTFWHSEISSPDIPNKMWDYWRWDTKKDTYKNQKYTLEIVDSTVNNKQDFSEFLNDIQWSVLIGEMEDVPGSHTVWNRFILTNTNDIFSTSTRNYLDYISCEIADFKFDIEDWDSESGTLSNYKYSLIVAVPDDTYDYLKSDSGWKIFGASDDYLPGEFAKHRATVYEITTDSGTIISHSISHQENTVCTSWTPYATPILNQWDFGDWDGYDEYKSAYKQSTIPNFDGVVTTGSCTSHYTLGIINGRTNLYRYYSRLDNWSVKSIFDETLPGIENYREKQTHINKLEVTTESIFILNSQVDFNKATIEWDDFDWDTEAGATSSRYTLLVDKDSIEFNEHRRDPNWNITTEDIVITYAVKSEVDTNTENNSSFITSLSSYGLEQDYENCEDWDVFGWDTIRLAHRYTLYLLSGEKTDFDYYKNEYEWSIGKQGIDDTPGLTRKLIREVSSYNAITTHPQTITLNYITDISDIESAMSFWDMFAWDCGEDVYTFSNFILEHEKEFEGQQYFESDLNWTLFVGNDDYSPLDSVERTLSFASYEEPLTLIHSFNINYNVITDTKDGIRWDYEDWDDTEDKFDSYQSYNISTLFSWDNYDYLKTDENWKVVVERNREDVHFIDTFTEIETTNIALTSISNNFVNNTVVEVGDYDFSSLDYENYNNNFLFTIVSYDSVENYPEYQDIFGWVVKSYLDDTLPGINTERRKDISIIQTEQVESINNQIIDLIKPIPDNSIEWDEFDWDNEISKRQRYLVILESNTNEYDYLINNESWVVVDKNTDTSWLVKYAIDTQSVDIEATGIHNTSYIDYTEEHKIFSEWDQFDWDNEVTTAFNKYSLFVDLDTGEYNRFKSDVEWTIAISQEGIFRQKDVSFLNTDIDTLSSSTIIDARLYYFEIPQFEDWDEFEWDETKTNTYQQFSLFVPFVTQHHNPYIDDGWFVSNIERDVFIYSGNFAEVSTDNEYSTTFNKTEIANLRKSVEFDKFDFDNDTDVENISKYSLLFLNGYQDFEFDFTNFDSDELTGYEQFITDKDWTLLNEAPDVETNTYNDYTTISISNLEHFTFGVLDYVEPSIEKWDEFEFDSEITKENSQNFTLEVITETTEYNFYTNFENWTVVYNLGDITTLSSETSIATSSIETLQVSYTDSLDYYASGVLFDKFGFDNETGEGTVFNRYSLIESFPTNNYIYYTHDTDWYVSYLEKDSVKLDDSFVQLDYTTDSYDFLTLSTTELNQPEIGSDLDKFVFDEDTFESAITQYSLLLLNSTEDLANVQYKHLLETSEWKLLIDDIGVSTEYYSFQTEVKFETLNELTFSDGSYIEPTSDSWDNFDFDWSNENYYYSYTLDAEERISGYEYFIKDKDWKLSEQYISNKINDFIIYLSKSEEVAIWDETNLDGNLPYTSSYSLVGDITTGFDYLKTDENWHLISQWEDVFGEKLTDYSTPQIKNLDIYTLSHNSFVEQSSTNYWDYDSFDRSENNIETLFIVTTNNEDVDVYNLYYTGQEDWKVVSEFTQQYDYITRDFINNETKQINNTLLIHSYFIAQEKESYQSFILVVPDLDDENYAHLVGNSEWKVVKSITASPLKYVSVVELNTEEKQEYELRYADVPCENYDGYFDTFSLDFQENIDFLTKYTLESDTNLPDFGYLKELGWEIISSNTAQTTSIPVDENFERLEVKTLGKTASKSMFLQYKAKQTIPSETEFTYTENTDWLDNTEF